MKLGEILFLLAVVAAVAVAVAMVPTESRNAGRNRGPTPRARVDWDRVEPNPNERVTLRWMGVPGFVGAGRNNWITRHLEQRFKLNLEPIYLDWNANDKRKPLMFAAGDVPDVIWEGDPLQVRRNIEQGFVIEIPYDLILKYAPTYVAQLNRCGFQAWLYARYQGHNYGLPTFAAGANRPRPGVWRKDWLEAVGIDQTPRTIEQMHEALYRFRHDDPDGDGAMDTYGMTPLAQSWSLLFADVFAAYGIEPFDFIERDGRLVWGGVEPQAKDVLDMLRRWYAQGLIDPDFPLAPSRTTQSFLDGKVGYVYDAATYENLNPSQAGSLAYLMRQLHPEAVLAASRPLQVVGGKPMGRSWGGAAHVIQFGRQLADQPRKVIRVLKMFEAFATNMQLYLQSRTGKRGKHWAYRPQRGIYLLPPYDQRRIKQEQMLRPKSIAAGVGFYSASTTTPKRYEPFLPKGELAFDARYRRTQWALVDPLGKTDVVPSAGRYIRDLRHYQMKTYMEFVIGRRSMDSFNEFVRTWRRMGGSQVVKEANRMYHTMKQIRRQVQRTNGD